MANIFSMTGYGKGEYNDGKRSITAEIKTINNRYCDISIKTPKVLRFFEDNIRKILKNNLQRGRIDVYINIEYISESDTLIVPNMALARQYKDAIDKIKTDLGINGSPSLDTIIRFQDVLAAKEDDPDDEELGTCLENAVNEAVKNLLTMREKEGVQLRADISRSVAKIIELMEIISENSRTIVEDMKILSVLYNIYPCTEKFMTTIMIKADKIKRVPFFKALYMSFRFINLFMLLINIIPVIIRVMISMKP